MDAVFPLSLAEAAVELCIVELQDLKDAKFTSDTCTSNSVIRRGLLQTKEGKRFIIKFPNPDVGSAVTEAALARDEETKNILRQISEGCCPLTLGFSKSKSIAIEEDSSGYEILQHRLLTEGKVDHGITCGVARMIAKIHKATHKNVNQPTFDNIRVQFGKNPATDFNMEVLFVQPFEDSNISKIENTELKKKARDQIHSPQFVTNLADIRRLFQDNEECLILGNLNAAGVLTKEGSVKISDGAFAMVGPSAFDLGSIIADYIVVYHSQILTEQDNDRHRKVAYCMMDAIQKTVEAYTEENTTQPLADLMSWASAFSGLELMRRALLPCDNHVPVSESARTEIFASGCRLFTKYRTIDNPGRLLMIGLQLC